MTTPQTPSQPSEGSNLEHLRNRYASGSIGAQVPQAHQASAPAAPNHADVAAANANLPHDDQVDPFADMDDEIQFDHGSYNTPAEWRDTPAETRRDDGPLFDTHTPSAPAPPRRAQSYGEGDDYFSGSDDYRVGAKKDSPKQGFRAFLANTLRVPVGKGKAELEYDNLITLINRSLLTPKVIGVIGGKGGVGKTTTVMALASTLASIRSKPVVAITLDYNGTLALRTKEVAAPARGDVSLLNFATDPTIRTPNDIAGCMKNNKHRLSVLGTGLNPVTHDNLTSVQFTHALKMLKSQFELVIIDFGNTPNSDAYWTALKSLDLMVLVTSTENDSMQGTRLVEGMAREAGLIDLLSRRTMEIVNHRSPADPKVDLDHFVGRVQSVDHREIIEIPWDNHFSESGPVDLDLLAKNTRYQFIRAAAIAVSNLPA